MRELEVPVDWTATDALVVVTFLDRLITAIWQAHGEEMSEALEAMNDAHGDELPF